MSDAFQFSCPECGKQMQLPAATAGRQGSCPACKKIVTIQPDPPAAAPAPAISLAEVTEPVGDVLAPPILEPQLVQPEMVQPGIVQPAGIQPVGMAPPMAQPQQSADRKKKLIIYAAAAGGGMLLLLLLLLLLLFMGGGDHSSPEALGRAAFNAVKSNDKDAIYSLGPSVGVFKSIRAQLLAEVEDEDERKEIEEDTTAEEMEENVKRWRDGIEDDFDDVVDALNWRDASVVTIVSGHDPDNPEKDGPRGNDIFTVCNGIFVVCDVKDDLYVLRVDGAVLIKGSWYIHDNDLRVGRLSELPGYISTELRTALERTKDSNRARILRELPKEDDVLF